MTKVKSKDSKNSLQNKILQPVVIISRFKILVRCDVLVFGPGALSITYFPELVLDVKDSV